MADEENDDILRTWADVQRRLKPMGRGAPYRLSQHLQMNVSFMYRKLKTNDRLSVDQARAMEAFFAGVAANDAGPPAAVQPIEHGLIPVYGYAAMGGEDLIALAEGQIVEWMRLPMGLEVGPGDWFIVRGIGSSMEPRIFAGEPLLVRRRHPPARGKDVLVEFNDGSGVIKTYQGERQGKVFVEQWNEPRSIAYDATKVRAIHGGIIKL